MFRIGFLSINSPLVLVFRNLRVRWVRTVLTTLGIVVGVAAMVAVNTTNDSTLQAINGFFDEAAGQGDLVVESAVSSESFDEAVLSAVRRFPGVVAAAPGVLGVTIPVDEAGTWEQQFGAGGATVSGNSFWLFGRDPVADAQVHEYELVDGRLLEPGEDAYSLILVDEYAEEKEVAVGDDFAIVTPGQGAVELRVVGLIAKEGIGVSNNGIMGIAPLSVVQDLFNLSGQISQIEVVVAGEIANRTESLDAFQAGLEARLGSDYDVKYPASRGEAVTISLENYQLGLNFFSVVSLFVGSFLIYNAFAMTVVERTREIGMQRAIGMTRRQVLVGVLVEAAVLGILGSTAGVGFGLLLAQVLIDSVANFAGQAIGQITVTPVDLVRSAAIGVAVTVAAATVPALQAARISPLQALRIQGSTDEERWLAVGLKFGPLTVLSAILVLYYVPFRSDVVFVIGSNSIFVLMLGATLCIPIFTGLVERLVRPLIIFVFGNEGRLGSSNIERARGRTTLTVAALMVGVSMMVGINGMTASFETDIQEWIDSALGGNLFVRSPLPMRPDLEGRLLGMEEVTAVTKSRLVSSRLTAPSGEDEIAVFVAIDPATYLSVRGLRVQEGPDEAEIMRQMTAGDAIFVGAGVANKFGLEVGDVVMLETKRGQRPFRVVATVVDFSGGETTTVNGSWSDLRRYFGVSDVSTFAVSLKPDASLEVVTRKIEDDIGRGENLSVESKQEFEEKIRELSAQAFSLFDVLGLIGLVVAALGVINTMLMNVLERTRELGALRSLGMSRAQVRRMILAEAATIGLIGALFGAGFGAVMADVFIIGLRSLGGFVLTSQTPYEAMALGFVVALAVAVSAAFYPAYRAGRVNIIMAIKHE